MSHLWESDHPYYACEGNYFSNDAHEAYRSWASFLESWGDVDMDYNLLYRWDWDKDERSLKLFFMMQRKARCMSVEVFVLEGEDEPQVREWLEPRWEKMRAIWAPLSGWSEQNESTLGELVPADQKADQSAPVSTEGDD